MGVHILCEKPFVAYAPPKELEDTFDGMAAPKEPMYEEVMASLSRIAQKVTQSGVGLCYFENFIYTPHIQKEREIIEKTGAQILRMTGEEAHKGSHAAYVKEWKLGGGGSLMATGSHPLGAVIYLKKVEGLARLGRPIRPAAVTGRIHQLTKIADFQDKGFLRSDYVDVEDYALVHVVFEDGTVADIFGGAVVLGGINDYLDVYANNHRARCEINPTQLLKVYNPGEPGFDDIYVNYGVSNNRGWLNVCPDENWMFGYDGEMFDALSSFAEGRTPQGDLQVALDTSMAIYGAYLSSERGGAEVTLQPVAL